MPASTKPRLDFSNVFPVKYESVRSDWAEYFVLKLTYNDPGLVAFCHNSVDLLGSKGSTATSNAVR